MSTFGQRLLEATHAHGRLCVGIDPHPSLLEDWGLDQSARGLREFSLRCVEAFAGHAALVKPQVAFFESYGSQGFAVLEEVLAALRETNTLSLADAKRGDIGSTMAAYASAWLDPSSPLFSDSVTVSPYLGVEALSGVVAKAYDNGGGVFVLAATSNPEARTLQGAVLDDATTLSQHVVDTVAQWNPPSGPGSIGVVVGATVTSPPNLAALNGPILLPGVGAQGADAHDVAKVTEGASQLALANISRGILSAGPNVADLQKRVKILAQDFPATN